jgi:competence protein ComEC
MNHQGLMARRSFQRLWSQLVVTVAVGLAVAVPTLVWGAEPPRLLKLVVLPLRYHGLAVVVQTPAGQVFAVDAGGAGEAGLVKSYLTGLGVERLRGILVSHTHGDHQGGVPALVEAFPVDRLYLSPLDRKTPESLRTGETEFSLKLRQMAASRGIQVEEVHAGCTLDWDPALKVDVLWPPEDLFVYPNPQPHGFYNGNSVVLRIQYGQRVFLLPGDLSDGAAAALVEKDRGRLRADLVVVPHHGFFGSKVFAEAVSAEVAVASCIVDYRDHPTRNVPGIQAVQLFAPVGTRVFVTAWQGEVVAVSDGTDLQVTTALLLPAKTGGS